MSSGNGTKPPRTYKQAQKNVSVYIGKKGDWQDELLSLVVKASGRSESQFMRECFYEKMIRWGLIDGKTHKPIPEQIEKLRDKANQDDLLPNVLDP